MASAGRPPFLYGHLTTSYEASRRATRGDGARPLDATGGDVGFLRPAAWNGGSRGGNRTLDSGRRPSRYSAFWVVQSRPGAAGDHVNRRLQTRRLDEKKKCPRSHRAQRRRSRGRPLVGLRQPGSVDDIDSPPGVGDLPAGRRHRGRTGLKRC